MMLNNIAAKCVNRNLAERFCVNSKCPYPSPICSVERCTCKQNHQQCMFTLQIAPFLKKFILKQHDTYDIEDPILTYYEMMLKFIDRDLKQYRNIKKQPYSQLSEKQRLLYKYLKQGPEASITPSLVLSVSKRLDEEPKLSPNLKLKNEIQLIRKQTDKYLNEVKQMWSESKVASSYQQIIIKQEEVVKQQGGNQQQDKKQEPYELMSYKFDLDLCTSGVFSSYFQISSDFKRIKRAESFNEVGYFCLLNPPLQTNEANKRVEFKILKIPQKSGISIGAIYGGTAHANHFKLKKDIGGGAYLLGSNGKTYNHYYANENRIETPLKFTTGDTVFMEFDSKNCKIRFYKNPKQKVTLSFIKDGRNFLHPCVLMWEKFTEVGVA